ncbi:hypothetical protein ACFQ12_26570, partial [Methylobacterium trifolii]
MRSDRHLVRLTGAMLLAFLAWMLPTSVLAHQSHAADHGQHAVVETTPSSPVFAAAAHARFVPMSIADAACGTAAPACCPAPFCCPACILSDPANLPARTARR